jgi:hypothetical protein
MADSQRSTAVYIQQLESLQRQFESLPEADRRAGLKFAGQPLPPEDQDREDRKEQLLETQNLLCSTAGRLIAEYRELAQAAGVTDATLNNPAPHPRWLYAISDLIGHDSNFVSNMVSAVAIGKLLAHAKSAVTTVSTDPDYKPAKWFEDHTTVSGNSLRRAILNGKQIRTEGSKGKKLYSLTDAKAIWGNDIVSRESA